MQHVPGEATSSYVHNVICPLCLRKMKNTEMLRRWDGLWVCKDDWEPRHPMDFLKTINDNHLLPFLWPDVYTDRSWTPSFTNRTTSGTVTDSATYSVGSVTGKTDFTIISKVTTTATQQYASATVTLPTTPGSAGTLRVFDQNGNLLGTATISGGASTVSLPDTRALNQNIVIYGQYGT